MNDSALDPMANVPGLRPPIPARYLQILVLFHAIALSCASVYFVLESATDEPYLAFVPRQAISQIGGPVTVITLWVYLAAAVLFGVISRRLALRWVFLIVVALAGIALVLLSPKAYFEDLFRFQTVKPAY